MNGPVGIRLPKIRLSQAEGFRSLRPRRGAVTPRPDWFLKGRERVLRRTHVFSLVIVGGIKPRAWVLWQNDIRLRSIRPAVLVVCRLSGLPQVISSLLCYPPTNQHGPPCFTPSQPSNRRVISGEIAAGHAGPTELRRGWRYIQAQGR